MAVRGKYETSEQIKCMIPGLYLICRQEAHQTADKEHQEGLVTGAVHLWFEAIHDLVILRQI